MNIHILYNIHIHMKEDAWVIFMVMIKEEKSTTVKVSKQKKNGEKLKGRPLFSNLIVQKTGNHIE